MLGSIVCDLCQRQPAGAMDSNEIIDSIHCGCPCWILIYHVLMRPLFYLCYPDTTLWTHGIGDSVLSTRGLVSEAQVGSWHKLVYKERREEERQTQEEAEA